MGVPVVSYEETQYPLGPAAGPHTQLAGNLVASYAAGATFMELKTVQILEGEALGIKKPCIYAGHEVFNTEWSTELTVEEAANEYIKANLLLQVLSREFSLTSVDKIHFICSVGYDLAGIQDKKVDTYLNHMKDASGTKEWQQDIAWLREHLSLFEHLSEKNLDEISQNTCVSDTVTLSTMHGCKAEEIGKIAKYLLTKKDFHTYVKMNPTLIGAEETRRIWNRLGYQNLNFREETFQHDIILEKAAMLIRDCKKTADEHHKIFGVKMTNTFPVVIEHGELEGDTMYASGAPLYPLAVRAAWLLARECGVNIPISYSGGADVKNIAALIKTGMKPITVSSILLQPGGYKNLSGMLATLEKQHITVPEQTDIAALEQLAEEAGEDERYQYRKTVTFEPKTDYDKFCAKCHNCVDVCPNRANIRVKTEERDCVLHVDSLCNECGCCAYHCIMGHIPYKEKFTVESLGKAGSYGI